jgi:hypothetical protein
MYKRITFANSTYPKVAVQWLNQALYFYQRFCLVDSEVLRNRHLRVAAKRYGKGHYIYIRQTLNKQSKNEYMKMKNLLLITIATLGLTSSTIAQNLPNYVPDNGLIGFWPFNGNANDESINGNDGIVNGALLTEDRFGESDHAYNFNGIDNFIDLGNSNSLNSIDTNFTISVWINDFSILDNSTIIACHSTGFQWRYLLRTLSDSISGQFVRNDINNWAYNYTESNSILENTWTNIIMLKHDSNFQIFINGALQSASIVPLTTTVGGNNNNADTKIGVNWPSSPDLEYFNGNIDDLGIWNRALNQQEISALYTGIPTNNNSSSNTAIANVPTGISYQAIARDAQGQPLNDAAVQVRFTLLTDSLTGAAEYSESHSLTTNSFGLFTTAFGAGTAETGTFAAINWASGTMYLKVELDAGSGFVDMGTQQLLSVPYSMRSNTSAKAGTIENAGLPVYADNAAALAGGLIAGQMYRTATGDLKIVY